LGHISLDGHAAGEPCLLDQLASPEQEQPGPLMIWRWSS
jgi:hypothetical protein